MTNSRTTSTAFLSIALLTAGAGVFLLTISRKRTPDNDTSTETQKSEGTQTVDDTTSISTATSARTTIKASPAEEVKDSVRLVMQRFRHASLLVDDKVVSVGEKRDILEPTTGTSCGLLVYVSFAKSANKEKVLQAAKTVLNLPLLTHGAWGDGSDTTSVLDMASSPNSSPHLLLVPQANLISKLKSQGRSIQYHGQIDKKAGCQLYEDFLNYVRALLLENQCANLKQPVPKWVNSILGTKKTIDASVPPSEMFQDPVVYSEWGDDGVPTKDAKGKELTKSASKKIKKQRESQGKRYEKYLKSAEKKELVKEAADWSLLKSETCTVIGGSFGGRQGLEISSDMGPFCHVVTL